MKEFLPQFEFSILFDGHTITGSMRALKRKDMLSLLPYLHPTEENSPSNAWEQNLRLQEIGVQILPDYITSFSGFKIKGVSASLEDVLEHQYFSPLVDALLATLIRGGQLQEEEPSEKKSAAPSTVLPKACD